jgi:hypothetical protein
MLVSDTEYSRSETTEKECLERTFKLLNQESQWEHDLLNALQLDINKKYLQSKLSIKVYTLFPHFFENTQLSLFKIQQLEFVKGFNRMTHHLVYYA